MILNLPSTSRVTARFFSVVPGPKRRVALDLLPSAPWTVRYPVPAARVKVPDDDAVALALDPVYTIGQQISESVMRHEGKSQADATARALEMLAASCRASSCRKLR